MDKFKRIFLEYWNLLFIGSLLIFVFQHFYFGMNQFQDCDSSSFYEYLDKTSISRMKSFIDNTTPTQFTSIRYFVAEISQTNIFKPLQKFIQLPYVSTYPPLMGLIFGWVTRKDYGTFYYISSLITGLSLLLSTIFIYCTFMKLKFEKKISFAIASLFLTLYSTNSYSYHLGSTVWYVFSISIGIFLLTVENKFLKDFLYFLIQFLSYPFIVWLFCEMITSVVIAFYVEESRSNIKRLKKSLIVFFKNRILTIFGLVINILLFFPFNSGYRHGPDLRGFFTIFSFQPLNKEPIFFTLIFGIFFYFLFFIGISSFTGKLIKSFKFDSKSINIRFKDNLKKLVTENRFKVFISCLNFLVLFFTLVILRKLTFTTTRHSLFILPPILTIASFGAESFLIKIKENNISFFSKITSFFIISFITFTFFISNYSNFQRVDILKSNGIPNSIINFVKNSDNLGYTIIGCSPQYKYANFDRKELIYNRKEPHNMVDLYKPGNKLLISQRPIISKSSGEFNNELGKYLFFGKPTFGDEIKVFSKNIKVKVVAEPYILKTQVYYDSLNKSSKTYNLFHLLNKLKNLYIAKFDSDKINSNELNNLEIYDWYNFYSKATGEEYRYPRPNDIWLVPIKVEDL